MAAMLVMDMIVIVSMRAITITDHSAAATYAGGLGFGMLAYYGATLRRRRSRSRCLWARCG